MKRKPQNVKELTGDLVAAYHEQRTGGMTPAQAKELSNMAGKIINAVRLEIEVCKINKIKAPKDIFTFVDTDKL